MNELVWWFGQNTLAALLMIPCVVLACRLFRDRPTVQHLLWLLILLKFVTPPVVVWPWSVDELQRMAWSQLSVHKGAHQGASLDPTPVATMSQLNEPRSVPFESAVVPSVSAPSIEPSSLPANVLILTDNANEKAPPTTPTNWNPIVAKIAILAWFIGAIGCAFSQLRRLARYARLVRSGEVAPPHLKAEVASVASLLSMKAPVCVIVKGVISPFLWCAGSARLAWPDSLSSQADVVRSRGIIAHELAHLRRCDHWITWLELGASILWWWNPLFWYVRRQLRETAEMSCDALAIAAHPESRREYAELLLRLSTQSTNEVPVPVIAMGAGNVASFEKRLKMILSSNVSGSLSWRGAVAIALLAVIALPYWSMAQSTNLEPSPTLAQQSDTAKESRKATEPDHDNDSIVVGEKPDTSANKVPSSTHQFIAAKPKHVNFVSSGTAEILNDRSVQLNPTDRWQEYALHFSPADLPSKISVVQLEILPRESAQSSNSKPAMLSDVKPHLKQQDGQTVQLDFSKCTFTGDVNDDLTVHCIDYLSDTGWQVPEFTDNHRVHHLLLHLEKPVEMENVTDFALTIDTGGAGQFSAVSRVRVSFADATSHLPALDETRRPGTRRTILVNGQSFSFRWCPSGEFLMGSPESKRSQYGDAFVTQHRVKISRGYWLHETEVTQAQYEMVTGQKPSFWQPLDDRIARANGREHTTDNPVEQVSWTDASSFCEELTKLDGKHRFRLPTEAEWEYACRAGRPECRFGEINDIAWVFENTEVGFDGSFGHRAVGEKLPNAWGLHDMLGNVSEWCSDWFGPPATQPTIDPTGPTSGKSRIARGGNCFADRGELRSDGACMAGTRDQDGGPPNDKVRTRGFRIVLVPDVDLRQLGTEAQDGKTGSTSSDASKTSEIAMRNQGDKNAADEKAKVSAKEKVEPWEISKLYEAAFLRKYLQDHEALPKPIVVPAVRGKVLDPNGKPATGVNLVSYTPRQGVTINPLNSGVKKSKQDGTFGLPERTEPYRVLLTHESGVANVSHEELLRAHGVITLQKWASVTGTLKLDGKPQAGETIVLHFDPLPWSYCREKLTIIHQTTTDKDGNFSFDRIPPLGGIAHARALGGTVYQCESGKNTHIEMGVGRTVTGKLQLPEHIQKSKLQVYARNHLLPVPYPKDWTDQVTQAERDAWRINWLQTAEGYEYADSNYVLVNSSVPGSIADDGTFTMFGVPERPMVLVVLLPGEAILLEQPFDTSNAPNSNTLGNALNLGTVTVSDTRLQRDNLHDHQHEDGNQGGQEVGQPHLPKLIVRTIDSKGTPVPNTWVRFYDRDSQRAGEKEEFEMVNKRTDESGVADFGVMPNSFGCLQLSPSNQEFAKCYTLISATMTECSQAKPPRANVQTETKDGILTVTFTLTPHVDLEFNIVDDATDEIVFWSEIFYQDPATNRWWQFALVDGSQLQHNFIPISPQITRETIRISALGYETKEFRLPNELDRTKPIRRDVRLKPMPDVELKVLLPDGTPAEKAKLTFHYPNELDCLQEHVQLSDAQGIVTTKFPPNADIGLLRLEHAGGTAELPMKDLLDDVKRAPGEVIQRSIQLTKSKKQNNAVIEKAVTSGDHTEKPASWIPGRPQKTTVSGGSFSILDDHSVRLEGNVRWQEVTTYFGFDKPTRVDEVRLELLPVDSPSGPQLGRGGEELILSEVTARLEKQTGKPTIHEFSSCISLLNPEDDLTIHCIDFLSDTGWIVPALPADAEAHSLVLRLDEPVTLQPDERLVLTVDSGGAQKSAVLNRIRFSFRQAATETGTVVLHAIDADTGEPIRDVTFVKENAVREDWATPVGSSGADGTVRIKTRPLPGYFFSILPMPQGYKVTSLDEVPAHVEVGHRVDYRFYLRKLGTNLEFVKNVPESNPAGNRFAEALKETNEKSLRLVVDDMPGFREQPVAFTFARDKASLAERIFANGELVRAAVKDELRYFEKAEGKLAGKISELYDIQVVISSSTLPRAPATSWHLYFRTKDGIELKQDGFKIRFEDLNHWDLEIPAFLHPDF